MEEFINLKQGIMSVEEYSLKFSMLSRYSPSLVSNPRYEMSCFVTAFADLGREECCTAVLHDYMIVSRLIVYAQSIEDYKLRRMSRSSKRSSTSDKGQPRFKKRAQVHEEPNSVKV